MGGIIMRQFNLEEYVKNPTRPIVTREGRNARVICTDRKGVGIDSPYPIVALIECHDEIETEAVMTFTPEGRQRSKSDSDVDLFFAPKEGWINIYKTKSGCVQTGEVVVYESKEEAEAKGKRCENYISTIKIEWEE